MGARQRAQNRGKSAKGSQKGSAQSQKDSSSNLRVPNLHPNFRGRALQGWNDFAASESSSPHNGFSMAQEARNTERHVMGWGNSRLRDSKISFVSAGNLTREEPVSTPPKSSESADVTDHGEDQVPQLQENAFEAVLVAEQQTADALESTDQDVQHQLQSPADTDQPQFSVDRTVATSSSSETEEEIVFHGRKKPTTNPEKAAPQVNGHAVTEPKDQVNGNKELKIPIRYPPAMSQFQQISSSADATSSSGPKRFMNSRYRRRRQNRRIDDDEEAIMQDYIANMAMDDDDDEEEEDGKETSNKPQRRNQTFRFYDGAGNENQKVQIKKATPKARNADYDQAIDWDSADLADFDDLSTTDEEVEEIAQVLRHRQRPTGPQYLVTNVGKTTSEAKWVLHAKLTSSSAVNEIRVFEEIQQMKVEMNSDDSEDTSDSDDEDDEALDDMLDDMDSEDDENDQVMKRTARMTDEQIARALAKQEELGLGGDEVMLFDGLEADEEDEDSEEDAFRDGNSFIPFSLSKHTSNRTRSKRNKKQRDSFPSAQAFADALEQDPYGGFDVMDFDRPSLRPKRKGRKSDFPFDFELSDEELASHLKTTWQKDRDKKAARKREKMEEKQAMLLEFADRGSPDAIKAEIRKFLLEETDTLKLAPMASDVRAGVHRLAKALKLHSRSEGKEGKGIGRYPVLTKTPHTPSYTLNTVWEIDNMMDARRFFPRYMDYRFGKSKKTFGATGKLKGANGGVAGASYMNGEVVGAGAPEIGSENKGRAMLEKMGWSSGTGIGAVGNKGNLEAIQHVFKTSKAGLG